MKSQEKSKSCRVSGWREVSKKKCISGAQEDRKEKKTKLKM